MPSLGRRSRKAVFAAMLLVPLIVFTEIVSWTLATSFFTDRGLVYDPRPPSLESFRVYLRDRHPTLGWPAANRQPDHDERGSRTNTFFGVSEPSCASVYGDSFAWSSGVGPESAWPNQLSALLGCRVDNFGIGGYGTDQALLRLLENETDRSRHLILAHTSENIRRNVNQFRGLISGGTRFGFKPRFILTDDRLELVPPIELSISDYEEVYRNPERYLQHELFLPGRSGAPVRLAPPYSLALLKTVSTRKLRGLFDDSTTYFSDLYDPHHPSKALQVTLETLQAFAREASERASVPLIVLVPLAEDVMAYRASGRWSYRNLRSGLDEAGVATLDFGELLVMHLDESSTHVCDLYRRVWYAKGGCTGHFNADGYRLLAESVHARLSSRNEVQE